MKNDHTDTWWCNSKSRWMTALSSPLTLGWRTHFLSSVPRLRRSHLMLLWVRSLQPIQICDWEHHTQLISTYGTCLHTHTTGFLVLKWDSHHLGSLHLLTQKCMHVCVRACVCVSWPSFWNIVLNWPHNHSFVGWIFSLRHNAKLRKKEREMSMPEHDSCLCPRTPHAPIWKARFSE